MARAKRQHRVSGPQGFAAAIAALKESLAHPEQEDRELCLDLAAWAIRRSEDEVIEDLAKVRDLLTAMRGFRQATGPGLTDPETTLCRYLGDVVRRWCAGLREEGGLGPFVDLLALSRNRRQEVCGALGFLGSWSTARPDQPMARDLKRAVLGVISRTRDHDVAVTALDTLITAGAMDEFEAMDRLEKWETRNEG